MRHDKGDQEEKGEARGVRRPFRAGVLGLIVISLLGVAAVTTAASASSNRERVWLGGTGLPGTPGEGGCLEDADLALQMTGVLEGCLSIYVEDYNCVESTDGWRPDKYTESGREVFVGTIATADGPESGTFETKYTLKATMAPGSGCDFEQQLSGGCTHRVVNKSGTGVFERARGVIHFFDRIEAPPDFATDYPYWGDIRLLP